MKKNQTEQEPEGIRTSQLAAFGLLIGGVLTVFLFLALIVSSIPGQKRTPASPVEPQIELAAQPPANMATTAPQKEPALIASEQGKTPSKNIKSRKKRLSSPILKPSGSNKAYSTSSAPGKTPKMVQVQ